MTLLGVISDTHDLLRPEAWRALQGCDQILHAGDVCTPGLLEELAALAPVRAVRGNNDRGPWSTDLPHEVLFELEGRRIHMVHDAADRPQGLQADLFISGHSHRPSQEERDGALLLNPGSAGPRRFRLPISLALVQLELESISVHHMNLESLEAKPPSQG